MRVCLFSLLLAASLTANEEITEILEFYCFDCHGYGKKEGGVSLENLNPSQQPDLWERVWRNVRTGMMPPAEGDPLEDGEKKNLLTWLETKKLGIDRSNPDPGRVTIRRLNRVEYRNTINDLLALDYPTHELFPPDDTGYGFDVIGDVLSLSPLLVERYFKAANDIIHRALPENAASLPTITIRGPNFTDKNNRAETGRFIEFMKPQTVEANRHIPFDGEYELNLTFRIKGSSTASDNTATLLLIVDNQEIARRNLGWDFKDKLHIKQKIPLKKGDHRFALQLLAGQAPKPGQGELGIEVKTLQINGPLDGTIKYYPESYLRIIPRDLQPSNREQWPTMSRRILSRFAEQAWRRPPPEHLIDQLTTIANQTANRRNSFEAGIRTASTAILTSPRFLLREEFPAEHSSPEPYLELDPYSLASRLSYFLWSSMPDQELLTHAHNHTLRANLAQQVDRMLNDKRANRFVQNFTGQWLQARDVETMNIRANIILRMRNNAATRIFNNRLREDMRRETETLFKYILLEQKPAIDLVSGNYTFLNERLAKYYKISGIKGEQLRKVEGHRGGILTQGTFLVVTSNPTRTSPVKRGLFVLDNLLGTPPPPAPPDVPELKGDRTPHRPSNLTMRERMIEHRKNPDCRSCHARMDPIGLAFENYTAVATFREKEHNGKLIDTSGKLVTGEEFAGVNELKQILATTKKSDFHRCLAEKLLTYALGRGVEYYDAPTIDDLVTTMEANNGSLHSLIHAITQSVPFQKTRRN
ncbi:MAG: DUF1592 domain-containing protein [Verrucomicrobiota bacterium]